MLLIHVDFLILTDSINEIIIKIDLVPQKIYCIPLIVLDYVTVQVDYRNNHIERSFEIVLID